MEEHTKSYYKYCIVPMCENNIKTAPDKIYFYMPRDANIRKKWCKAMRRDNVSSLSSLYCCEDHFDIEKDTVNYIKYKIMALEHGQKVSLLLKKGVIPHKFQCQKKDKLQLPPERKGALKRKRQALVQEALAEAALSEAGPSTASIPNCMDMELNSLKIEILKRACCNSDPPTPKDSSYDVEKEISHMDMYHKDDNLQEDEDPLYDMSYKSEPGVLDESHIKKEVPLQPELRCRMCHGDIIGFRYTCVQCADWDMCASCEARGEHPAHYVLRLPNPKPSEECEPVIAAIREHIHNLLRLREEIKSEIESNEEIFNAEIPEELFDPHLTDPLQAAVDREVPELNICLQSSTEQNIADVQQVTTSSAPTEESPPPTVDAPRIVDNQTYSGLSDLAKECISSKTRLKIRAKRKQELKTRTEI